MSVGMSVGMSVPNKETNESMILVSALMDELSERFKSNDVWYQVSDTEVPIYFVGFESLVYYKVQNGEVIWKSLY